MKLSSGTRKIIILAIILGIGIAAYIVTMTDTGPPDLTGLKVKFKDIPPNENAFTYFDKAASLLDRYEKTTGNKINTIYIDEYNSAVIANQLARNKEVLSLFQQGLACRELQFPEVKTLDALLPYLQPMRAMAKLQSNHALYLFMNGRQKDAFDLLAQTHRYGCMIQNGKGAAIHCLVGIAVKALSRRRFQELLPHSTLPPAVLVRYVGLIDDEGSKEGLGNALRLEFSMFSSVVSDLDKGKLTFKEVKDMATSFSPSKPKGGKRPSRFSFKPNLTRSLYARALKRMIENIEVPYDEMAPAVVIETRFLDKIIYPNGRGRELCNIFLPAMDRILIQGGKDRISTGMFRLLIALKCFQTVNGRLPDNLDELVPQYIDSIPIDYFDGKPLKYSRQKRVLYTVGEDLKDSGGPDPSWWRDKSAGAENWEDRDPGVLITL